MRFIALAALVALAGCKKESSQDEVETGPGQKAPDKKKGDEEKLPEIQVVAVAPGISMLVGMGGNIGVVTSPRGALVIDDQLPPMRERVTAAIAKLGGPARVVVNTHWHGDHTGNNEALAGEGAVIVAHENVRKQMAVAHEMFGEKMPASPDAALPVVTFAEDVTLHWGDQELHVVHVPPAHTDGDSIIHFPKANVIHTGDTYFNGGYPFIDTSTGGGVSGMIAACDRVLELANAETKIIPGHGPLSNRAELEKFRAMLVAARDRVRPLVAAGKSVEKIVAEHPTREWDDTLGKGFVAPDLFIQFLVDDAKRAAAPR